MYSTTYKNVRDSAARSVKNETRDCAVIATAIVTKKSYDEAHRELAQRGRKHRTGSEFDAINFSVLALGGDIEGNPGIKPEHENVVPHNKTYGVYTYIRKPNGGQYTTKTIGKALPKGRYLVYTSRHVSALVDGQLHDWAENRCKRVWAVTKVTLPGEKKVAVPVPQPKPIVVGTKRTRRDGAGQYTRNGVRVAGITYRSVKQAFEALGLPLSKHIAFRMRLKKSGHEIFEGNVFELA